MTGLAPYGVALAAGLGTLILFRKEHALFQTGLACAAMVFIAGVIAMSQQNMVGAGLVLASPFMMLIVTSLLPWKDRSIEGGVEAALDPTPAGHGVGRSRPPLGVARFAKTAFVLALTAAVVYRGLVGADDTIDHALRLPIEIAARAPGLHFLTGDESECLSPSGATSKEAACGPDERG